ncbi:hypothetical protein LOD99_1557 [Oopsacas minuta]|uniref:ISXO2-like transposase domain-containing protein n=1 Tax=Oopsacas minuta TaxID=111878 RepID=A0AAV7K6Z2_9METZ|nr:hypothetical protein LOD99_1557 [Oopsacas minuta]
MYVGAFTDSKNCNNWRSRACKTTCSLRYESFFKSSNLSLPSLLQFLYFWSVDIQSHAFLRRHLQRSPNTVVDWKSFMRDVCIEDLIINQEPIGGPGTVVEIDESKFGRRKYNHGRLLTGQWVFGLYEQGTDNVLMIPVPDCSGATLLAIIQRYVLPGTTIQSDGWAAYNVVPAAGYAHYTVNNFENFVDLIDGAQTQGMENAWDMVKKTQRRGQTTNPELLESHLIEFCWRRKNKGNIRYSIVKCIRELYPVV